MRCRLSIRELPASKSQYTRNVSKTKSVNFCGRNIWVWDSSLAAWLVTFIDVLAEEPQEVRDRLASLMREGRAVASIADIGLDLDRYVSQDDTTMFVRLATAASERIRAAGPIDWAALSTRSLSNEDRPDLPPLRMRGSPTAADVASVGDAIVGMFDGSLPAPPAFTWWCIGGPRGRTTIDMLTENDRVTLPNT